MNYRIACACVFVCVRRVVSWRKYQCVCFVRRCCPRGVSFTRLSHPSIILARVQAGCSSSNISNVGETRCCGPSRRASAAGVSPLHHLRHPYQVGNSRRLGGVAKKPWRFQALVRIQILPGAPVVGGSWERGGLHIHQEAQRPGSPVHETDQGLSTRFGATDSAWGKRGSLGGTRRLGAST